MRDTIPAPSGDPSAAGRSCRRIASEGDDELDTSTPLLLTLATGYRISDAKAVLQEHTWSGDKPMTIRLCALAADGTQREHDVVVKPTALDLGLLLRDRAHMIANLEYAA